MEIRQISVADLPQQLYGGTPRHAGDGILSAAQAAVDVLLIYKVLRAQSFTLAAQNLHMAQSTLNCTHLLDGMIY